MISKSLVHQFHSIAFRFRAVQIIGHQSQYCKMAQAAKLAAVDTQSLNYEQIAAEVDTGKIVLIDVREKDETINDGIIPTSKNIPLGELATAIKLDNQQFQEMFSFEKPKTTDSIVCHCRKGPRAFNAASILRYGGYDNVRVYSGILDWKENGGKLESP